ncbi:hypothetical protein HHK36_028804 [Tetracentron sinense]|uniref:Alpha/beta hydrolase fold-3 domain-containing protein n=1 Tax=Tetracentron sinense TaxID=13715 RepID=A0A834YFP8_TETSI|nr:hypothetical protein HHK36_028804 [Tetracentron sinense]
MSDHPPSENSNNSPSPDAYCKIVDGTFIRHSQIPTTSASGDDTHSPVLSKDIPLNPTTNTWLRLFRPRHSSSGVKLPLIIYVHGGGFVLCSAASTIVHDFCANISIELPALIISVDYRLAPEHRLPAAYEDAVDAMHWITKCEDQWLRDLADFSRCFVMGESAGGNIAYHAGLRAAAASDDLEPLKIKGLILHQPFFGGSQRTMSELKLVNDRILPLSANDMMWEQALPIGANRDHEYCNPLMGGGSSVERVGLMGWWCLVSGCDGDPLMDRQVELVRMLERKGVRVVSRFLEGGHHGMEVLDSKAAQAYFLVLRNFVFSIVPSQ